MKASVWWFFLPLISAWSVSADHSILELIDTQRVEKLLAQYRQNQTSPHFVDTTTNTVIEDVEENQPDVNKNALTRNGRKNSIPDISSVLMEIAHPDKLLKAEPTSMLVTKKEHIKKDWCRTEPILQKVREEGCTPKNVINRFCYGQCNSFFIPKNLPPRRGRRKRPEDHEDGPAFRSCSVCKPKKLVWVQVTLHCPGQDPPLRRRRVQKVRQCQCMAENIQ